MDVPIRTLVLIHEHRIAIRNAVTSTLSCIPLLPPSRGALLARLDAGVDVGKLEKVNMDGREVP